MRRAPDERERRDPGGCGRSAESQAAWALAEEVLAALREADLGRLIRMVGPHPRVAVDSGEEPGAADCPRLLRALGFTDRVPPSWELHAVNGGPGLVCRRDGSVVAVVVLAGGIGAVTDVWVVANPDKLRRWNAGTARRQRGERT